MTEMRLLNRATYWPGREPTHRVLILWLLGKRKPLFITEDNHPEKFAELTRRRSGTNSEGEGTAIESLAEGPPSPSCSPSRPCSEACRRNYESESRLSRPRIQEPGQPELRVLLGNHTLTPHCRACAEEFDRALAEYREKYA